MADTLGQTPVELVDFNSTVTLSRHIEISQRVTHGPVTIGRYLHRPNPGVAIGATQYATLIQEGAPYELEWLVSGGEGIECRLMEPGAVHIHPSDTLVYKHWRTTSRMLFLAIDNAFVEQNAREVFGERMAELKPQIGVRDPVIEGMAEVWRRELQEGGVGGRILAEAQAISLIVHLFRTYASVEPSYHVTTGGMNGVRLRRVIEHIEAHLSEDMSLCTLASVAGLSVDHFYTVFKAETGATPHHFVIKRRVHRAKELLLGTDMPLSEIALVVGFSNQSHFTVNFRKVTRTTPLRFRVVGKKG